MMIDKTYMTTMARYNAWQNESLMAAADRLSDEARKKDRGAFFNSIQQTFSHILWADQIWLSRFADTPAPEGSILESKNYFIMEG